MEEKSKRKRSSLIFGVIAMTEAFYLMRCRNYYLIPSLNQTWYFFSFYLFMISGGLLLSYFLTPGKISYALNISMYGLIMLYYLATSFYCIFACAWIPLVISIIILCLFTSLLLKHLHLKIF